MVESVDRLSNLVKHKAGLTKAILLPYCNTIDLVRLSAVNHAWNNFFEPSHAAHHINFSKVFLERLSVSKDSDEYSEASTELLNAKTWREVLEI